MVLDVLVQSRRDKRAAKRLLHKLLKRQCRAPRVMITDKLPSYGAAKLTRRLPRQAYNEQANAIAGRLKESGRTLQEVDPTAPAELKGLLDQRDYDGANQRIAELERNVRIAVAARDLPALHTKLLSRVATLEKQLITEAKVLSALRADLEKIDPLTPSGEALATLEQQIAPLVSAAEDRVGGFLSLRAQLNSAIAELKRRGAKESDAFEQELVKCTNLAKQKLSDAAKRLNDLKAETAKAEVELEQQMQAKLEYPVLLDEITQRLDGFGKQSQFHASYNLTKLRKDVDVAEELVTEGEFVGAINALSAVDDWLDEWDRKAWESDKTRSEQDKQQAAEKAAIQKQKMLAEAKAKAKAKEAAETADSTSSLDAIGRDARFAKWLAQVHTLLTKQIVTLSMSDPYWLPGDTVVEIAVELQGTGNESAYMTDFVIHYHPDASTKNPYGSPVHAKPYPGNANTVHVDMPTSHWLFGPRVPSLTGIRKEFRVTN
jgi:DDE domain